MDNILEKAKAYATRAPHSSSLARLTHSSKAHDLELELDHSLADSSAAPERAIALLNEYRVASANIVASDFIFARAHGVETRLWSAHSRLNARLRKQLTKLRKDRANRLVESRKLTKLYLDFLKASQRFYREHIQTLNSRYGAITELERISRQAKLDSPNVNSGVPVPPDVQRQVVLSCHQTLIYLGDLFRYRAAERLDKEPDWGPAIGYYDLAATLRPASGMAYHQQSVIAFEQGDHLRSTYFLYRSIVVEEPHPNAVPNLELQFKKISIGWDKGDLVPKSMPQDPSAPRKALLAWFIRFHSMSYQGQHFPEYEELEKEVLGRTAAQLKSLGLDALLLKMSFINFAAQASAASQFRSNPDRKEFMQSFFVFLRFNLKFFSILLDSYCTDLAAISPVSRDDQHTLEHLTAKVTDLARQTLPSIRLYSAWLLTNSHIVAARVGDEVLQTVVNRFWKTYAESLSLLASSFPFPKLPDTIYQLEEDVDALEFSPLKSEPTKKLWNFEDSDTPRPKWNDHDVQRQDPDIEILARVRGLLYDGLLLAVNAEVPIAFLNSRFVFEGNTTESVASEAQNKPTSREKATPAAAAVVQEAKLAPAVDIAQSLHNHVIPTNRRPDHVTEQSGTHNREAQLSRMVDDLVGPEDDDEDDDNLSPIPSARILDPAPVFGPENGKAQGPTFRSGSFTTSTSPRGLPSVKTPDLRSSNQGWHPANSPLGSSSQRLQSVSSIWGDSLPLDSPRTPYPIAYSGPPRMSPSGSAHRASAHSRGNSASSTQSPVLSAHNYNSFDPTPQSIPARNDRFHSLQSPNIAGGQYLMFGAGSSPWSTGPRRSLPNITPPNGQGG
ncbi:hypothetical protein MBLNU459_g3739t1 [Dothideomycetes sp. NU459]